MGFYCYCTVYIFVCFSDWNSNRNCSRIRLSSVFIKDDISSADKCCPMKTNDHRILQVFRTERQLTSPIMIHFTNTHSVLQPTALLKLEGSYQLITDLELISVKLLLFYVHQSFYIGQSRMLFWQEFWLQLLRNSAVIYFFLADFVVILLPPRLWTNINFSCWLKQIILKFFINYNCNSGRKSSWLYLISSFKWFDISIGMSMCIV